MKRVKRYSGVVCVLLAGSVGLWACATGERESGREHTESIAGNEAVVSGSDWSALDRYLVRERRTPVRSAMQAPPPPGLDSEELRSIRESERERALMSLEDVLAEVKDAIEDVDPLPPVDRDEESRRLAMQQYIAGRMARLTGELDKSLEMLEASARLNPDPSDVWREIGETQLALGNRPAAAVAFDRAFERDREYPRTLEQVALLATEDRDAARAAAMLARLRMLPGESMDPAMRYVLPARLGESLLSLGYLRAGVALLVEGLDLPERFEEATARVSELSALYRRRGDLLRSSGDALMRLGEIEAAAEMYALAEGFPTLDPDGLRRRHIHALMRLGRPAAAARLTMESTDPSRMGVSFDEVGRLLSFVCEHGGPTDAVVETLLRQRDALSDPERRVRGGAYARLLGSVMPRGQSPEPLRAWLAESPRDEATLGILIAQAFEHDPEASLREAIKLMERRVQDGDVVIRVMLRQESDSAVWSELLAGLPEAERRTRTAQWLGAMLEIVGGRLISAESTLAELAESDDLLGRNARAWHVGVLTRLGFGERASDQLAGMPEATNGIEAMETVRAWLGRGDAARAMHYAEDAIERWGDATEVPDLVTMLLTGAKLAISEERASEGETWLLRAMEVDPSNEEVYRGLISLYIPGGRLADEQKLVEAVRRMRSATPSSRTLAWLRARDALARGQRTLAEQELLALAQRYPDDEPTVTLLVQLWMSAGAHDRAMTWLAERAEIWRGDGTTPILQASVELSRNRNDEAARLLRSWVERYPGDDRVSRLLENIYRARLSRTNDADEIALRRLTIAPETLRSLEERSLILMRRDRSEETLALVERIVEHPDATREGLGAWGNELGVLLTSRANSNAINPMHANEMFTLICEHADVVPAVHQNRMIILAASGAEPPEIAEAILGVARQDIRLGEDVMVTAVQTMLSGRVLTGPQRDAQQVRERLLQQARQPRNSLVAERSEAVLDMLDHLERSAEWENRSALIGVGALSASHWYSNIVHGRAGDPEKIRAATVAVYEQLGRLLDYERVMDALDFSRRLQDRRMTDASEAVLRESRVQLLMSYHTLLNRIDPHVEGDAGRLSDQSLRIVLDLDPNNVLANNNLGYRMLLRDENIDQAARMIEIAHQAEPDSPPYTDSMGWARYKQGIFEDKKDPETGEVVMRGAISLLREARRLAQESRDEVYQFIVTPIVADHLGDALWAAGRREEALEAWDDAWAGLDPALRLIDQMGSADMESTLVELRKHSEAAREKARAARSGLEPEIESIPGLNPDERPQNRRETPQQ